MCDTYHDIAYGMLSIISYTLSLYLFFDTYLDITVPIYCGIFAAYDWGACHVC